MKKLLRAIVDFFLSQRRSGTTTLLKKVASENDVWVLVPNDEMRKEFGDKGISFHELDKFKGRELKPILVDNFTMLKLCDEFHINITELETAIRERDLLVNSIEHLISNFRRGEKQFYKPTGTIENDRLRITYFNTDRLL